MKLLFPYYSPTILAALSLSLSSRPKVTSFLIRGNAGVPKSVYQRSRSQHIVTIPRGGCATASPSSPAIRGATTTTEEQERISVREGDGTSSLSSSPPYSSLLTRSEAYRTLVSKLETITHLGRASSVLSYDQLVFMPPSASAERGAQMAALASVIHEKRTDPELLTLMDLAASAIDDNGVNQDSDAKDARRLIDLERKAFLENQRIPTELAAKAASLSSSAYSDWVAAKEKKDFAAFVPALKECFDTAMALAAAKMGEQDKSIAENDRSHLYDQMLDEFEVGMAQSRIEELFDQVRAALVPLIADVLGSSTPPSAEPLEGTFDIDRQKALSETLVTAIGFRRENGRIDVSVHPFSSSMSPADVRITSRFHDDDWYQGLAGTLHEGGHAIYEQNLNPSALTLDSALSMGTHESQSLFWERHIGLSKPFWKFAHPHLIEAFASFEEYTPEQIYGAVNRVSQSLIRVEADELTYPLHVILRYTIEKEVMAGKLKVEDISQRWNALMKDLLNVEVPSDDQGALQDVHWSAFAIGYFPTYLIGAITAAQLYHYCEQDLPDLEKLIESGNFAPINDWLKSKVHRHGRRYPSLDAMLEDQLGEPLNSKYFIEYLTNKYRDLYKI